MRRRVRDPDADARRYISAAQASPLSLWGKRGRGRRGPPEAPLLLLTHRCSLSPRNKSVRKPRRSHGEAGAAPRGAGRGGTRPLPGTPAGTGGNASLPRPGKGLLKRRGLLGRLEEAFPGRLKRFRLCNGRLLKTPGRRPWSRRWRFTELESL